MNGMEGSNSSTQDGSRHDLHSPHAPRSARTIAFMNQKGGVGKTTTTVNVGAALAMRGRTCLLIDLDPQAHCTLHFGIEPLADSPTAYDLLLDPECSAYEAMYRGRVNLDLIPAEVGLAAAEVELTTQPGREMILREKIEALLPHYDYVLFDCPPSLGLLTLNALVASSEVIIPMQAQFLPLQGVGKLLETVSLVRQRLNRSLTVGGIVLCAHDGQTTLAREIVADLRAFFDDAAGNRAWEGCTIFEPYIRRNIKLAEAPSFGRTIFEYEPWCAGAHDYAGLTEALIRRWEGEEAPVEVVESAGTQMSRAEGENDKGSPAPEIDITPDPMSFFDDHAHGTREAPTREAETIVEPKDSFEPNHSQPTHAERSGGFRLLGPRRTGATTL